MAESARELFEGLEEGVDPARTRGTTASYRFDVEGVGSWHVDVNDGDVDVTKTGAPADCVIRASEENLLRVVRGDLNPVTAYMTGRVKVEGDITLAKRLRDLFG
ncbi:MAG: SCP2 sterol-binding domain-containing protein [Actinomycetota bacterium]|nr:SCP2 sterol-binding domain-containing protein [Actinomycetota bacterium]